MIPTGDENPFQENPYTSPEPSGDALGASPYQQPAGRNLVGHVAAVAILMVVQGVLELFMGLMLMGMGFVMPQLMRGQFGPQGGVRPQLEPEAMSWILLAVYGIFGLIVLCAAVLHIVAGVRNYKFRSRTLGIVALIAGMVATLFTCYCAPTAIALGIYGLICYLNPAVVQAFDTQKAPPLKNETFSPF